MTRLSSLRNTGLLQRNGMGLLRKHELTST
jgi:hypothetical protein